MNEIQQKIRNWADFTRHQWFHVTKQQSEFHSWKEIPVISTLPGGNSTPSKIPISSNCSDAKS